MKEEQLEEIEIGLQGAEWLDKSTALQLIREVRRLQELLIEASKEPIQW